MNRSETSTARISHRDQITLSPWEKWVKYKRFPWKIVIHVLLIISTTSQLVLYSQQDAEYFRAARRNWYYYFFPESYDFSSRTHYLYTVNDVVGSVQHALNAFDEITFRSIDFVNYTYPGQQMQQPCIKCGKLEVLHYRNDSIVWDDDEFIAQKQSTTEFINSTYLGPLDSKRHGDDTVMNYIRKLVEMRLHFSMVSYNVASLRRTCIVWDIQLVYNFQARGQIKLELESYVKRNCDTSLNLNQVWTRLLWLNFIILGLAIVHLVLNARSLIRSAYIYKKARRLQQNINRERPSTPNRMVGNLNTPLLGLPGEVATLSIWDMVKFFNLWFLCTMMAAICLITHALLNLTQNIAHAPTAFGHKIVAGLGCALLWATIVAYLAHKPGYYTVVLTLNRAIPRVIRFMVGVIPILLGYALFGMLYFGDYTDRFGSFQLSMISLFSVLNGDVIRETFMDIIVVAPIVTQIYLYSFITLFIYVVLNVFIAIVEESYFSSRSNQRSMESFAESLQQNENHESNVSAERFHRINWFHALLEELDTVSSTEESGAEAN